MILCIALQGISLIESVFTDDCDQPDVAEPAKQNQNERRTKPLFMLQLSSCSMTGETRRLRKRALFLRLFGC